MVDSLLKQQMEKDKKEDKEEKKKKIIKMFRIDNSFLRR